MTDLLHGFFQIRLTLSICGILNNNADAEE
jgi:hypothetical protein